jgi:hypothetical protein
MDICELLKEIDDMSRLCQRFLLGRAEFSDLIAVHATIGMWSTIRKRVEQEKSMENIENPNAFQTDAWRSLDDLFHRMSNLQELAEKISAAVIFQIDSSTDINDIDVDEPTSTAEDNILDSESLVSGKSDSKKWAINPKSVLLVSRFHDQLSFTLCYFPAVPRNLQGYILPYRIFYRKKRNWSRVCIQSSVSIFLNPRILS